MSPRPRLTAMNRQSDDDIERRRVHHGPSRQSVDQHMLDDDPGVRGGHHLTDDLGPAPVGSAADLGVLPLNVLPDDDHVEFRARTNGDLTPGRILTGRRFTYFWNSRRIGMSSPHSVTWSGMPGWPTAPRKMASPSAIWSMPSLGIMAPSFRERSDPQSRIRHSSSNPLAARRAPGSGPRPARPRRQSRRRG
jgi:hypothetical protein